MTIGRCLVADAIRFREIDGCAVILDLCSERYSVLNELGTGMWACLTGAGDSKSRVRRWSEEYSVTADDILRSMEEFRADCVRKGLLRPWESEGPQPDGPQHNSGWPWLAKMYRRLPAWVLAIAALTTTALSLKCLGFGKTYGRRSGVSAASPSTLSTSLESIVRPFLLAENFVFFSRAPNDCLMRSLALFHYLRWRGVPAVHVIGVRRVPFIAHAWVEVAGEGVLAPRPRGFVPLATLVATSR
ncbi:MAG: lasso peptide biosynthesis B2 protein [Pseudomonadota bacterium]|nr:lasso peptide biosynthesis B2 protein [Pseudomonadota bacterium]